MIYVLLAFFIATTFFTFVALCLSVYFGYRLGRKVLVLEEEVEESLDLLEACHQRLFNLANTPVLHDEPIIRDVLNQIRRARTAVLQVANKLVAWSDSKDEDDEDEEDTDS